MAPDVEEFSRDKLEAAQFYGGIVNDFPSKENQEDQIPSEREIKINGGSPDLSYRDEMRSLQQESQIQRLNQRITLLAILVPCMLGVILVFAYFELRDRLAQVQVTGSKEVRSLSEDVVDKTASLSDQYTELEKSLSDRLSALKKSTASIKEDLKRNQREVKKIVRSKADKKALEQAMKKHSAEVADTFSALQGMLHDQKQIVENLEGTLRTEVANIVQAIERAKNNAERQDSAIKALSKRKIDKQGLANILEDKWSSYQATISMLKKEIKSIREEVSRLQKQINMTAGSSVPEAQTRPKEKSAAETVSDAPAPVPNDIIEQEISE